MAVSGSSRTRSTSDHLGDPGPRCPPLPGSGSSRLSVITERRPWHSREQTEHAVPPGSLCTLSVDALEWLKAPLPPTENAGREEGFSRREQPFSNSHITEPKSPGTSKASPPILLCRSQRPETVTVMPTRGCGGPQSRKHLCLLDQRVPGLPWRQTFHIGRERASKSPKDSFHSIS